MKKFELKNISEQNLFIGDIFMIEKTFRKLIDAVREANPECEDLSPICYSAIAKEDAILIKIDENKYIDLDGINSNKDVEIINELLNSGSINNNIILSQGTLDPYVGELYIGYNTLSKVKDSEKILEKKLNTLN